MNELGKYVTTEMLGQETNALFIAVWRRFAESFHNADVARRDGLAIGWPDVPLSVYNNIFLMGSMNDPARFSRLVLARQPRLRALSNNQASSPSAITY